jgi:hypothetical protein
MGVPSSWLVPFTRIIALPVATCARAEDVQCRKSNWRNN